MKHTIDTDELEKLKVMNRNGDLVIYYDDLIKALANSPQADGMVLTSEMISAGAVPINNWNNRNRKNKTPISPMERAIAHQVFDAMLSAYKPQVDDVRKDAWLPIETAPKDGSSFDVWLGNCDESDRQFYCTDNTRRSPDWHYKDGKFRPHISLGVMPTFVIPTHWMPLPSPPLDKARE